MSSYKTINTLISTFPGLPNYTLHLPASTQLSDVYNEVHSLLPAPPSNRRLLLSTTSGKIIPQHSTSTLEDLTADDFVTLRLHPTLCGGKGGFGSQLRAAGGRMSSRKKRGQQENNDSCRNLDGRRMRTVKEAKALAAYLEIKPEMDKKEKEARRERWKKIVESAERKETRAGVRFDDVKWLEETEEERERTREAVLKAMKEGFTDRTFSKEESESSGSGSDGDVSGSEEEVDDSGEGGSKDSEKATKKTASGPRFAGFDDDDEFVSFDEDEAMEDISEADEPEEETKANDKGKKKAIA
ncbi:hypothetical protein RUND412_003516 [Rhizina undulata]